MESTKRCGSFYPAEGKMNLSFAGCGFLGIYHVGVASCFKKYAPHVYQEQITGASAGALVACALISDCSLGDCTTFTLNLALECRKHLLGPFSPNFHLVRDLRKALNEFLPQNAHKLTSGKLHVSLTRFPDFENVLVSQFNSKEDLIDALICSSYVPFYSGVTPPCFQGKPYMDGGFSNNHPTLDQWTVKISPFAGESDICPNDQSMSMHHINISGTSTQLNCNNVYRASVAFLPPSPEILSEMCQTGFEDALRFLRKNGMISCSQHISIHSAVSSSHPFDDNLLDEHSIQSTRARVLRSIKHARVSNKVKLHSLDSKRCRGGICFPKCSDDGDGSDGEEEEDGDESDKETCKECHRLSECSQGDKPPSIIIKALNDACMEANRGLRAKLYKYKFLVWLVAPYVIPCSVTYAVVKKFFSWAPSAPDDIRWFLGNMYNFFVDILESDQTNMSSQSKEKLVLWISFLGEHCGLHRCQKREFYSLLYPFGNTTKVDAATDGDDDGDKVNPDLAVASTSSFKMDKSYSNDGGLLQKLQSGDDHPHNCHHHQQQQQHSLSSESVMYVTDDLEVVNVDVDCESDNVEADMSGQLEENSDGLQQTCPEKSTLPQRSHVEDMSLNSNLSTVDTYENCLHITNQMDAILSYCYLEESNNSRVNAIEIIPLEYV